MRQPNEQIPPSPENNKNFNILAGCLKKSVLPNCEFAYWSPSCYRQPATENYFFGRFLFRLGGIKQT